MSAPSYKTMSLADEVVLITGATAGIGAACAWRFAEVGARLVLVGRRKERLEQLKASLVAAYPSLPSPHLEALDVTDLKRVEALPETLPPGYREVAVLVNNAGLALGTASVQTTKMSDAITMINTNVTALIAMARAFTPGMVARGKGHLINMGSIAGHESYAGGSVYCATKHAVEAYTASARHDLVATPVRVSAISPGFVNTEFSTVRLGDKEAADKVYEDLEPLYAEDIADNVIYVATRPAHVQVADMIIYPCNQAGPKNVARVGKSLGAP